MTDLPEKQLKYGSPAFWDAALQAYRTAKRKVFANEQHERCSKCGGEKDVEGWCANYCMDEE